MFSAADIDFLGKDLTNTPDIQSEVNRAQTFIQLDQWEKAKTIYSNLSDRHPESPCGWFGLARVLSRDFTQTDFLEHNATISQYDKIKQYIQYCEKTADEFRKDEYQNLFSAFSYQCEKHFAEQWRNKFSYVIDATEEVAEVSANNCPQNRSVEQYIIESLGIFLYELIHDKSTDFYNFDYQRIKDISTRFPSVDLILMHHSLIHEFLQVNHHHHKSKNPQYSLASAIAEHNPDLFKNADNDPYVADVLRLYVRFVKVLRFKLGNVESVIPSKYYENVAHLYKQAVADENKRIKIKTKKRKKPDTAKVVRYSLIAAFFLLVLFFGFFSDPDLVNQAVSEYPSAAPIINFLASICSAIDNFFNDLYDGYLF